MNDDLEKLLRDKGAALVGAGDMRDVNGCSYPVGVAVAVPVPAHVVADLKTAPTKEYYELYDILNDSLNHIIKEGESFLKERGFDALARTTDIVEVDEDFNSGLPHKTVATRAGLGWIGKNNLLVTPEYGSAIRISSLLTDAPLETAEPYLESKCGACRLCVDACPGKALKGTLWSTGMLREEIVDVWKCYEAQLEIMKAATGLDTDLCGRCFAVCARTQSYLKRSSGKPL